ncbi:hypothetical protein QQ045_027725 [Rhodiola kirilowii]
MAKQRVSSISIIFTKPRTSIIIVLVILLICMFAVYYTVFIHSSSNHDRIDYAHFHDLFLATATNSTLASYLRDLTLRPHLAGTPQAVRTANYVKTHFANLGLKTEVAEYSVLLSYPKHVSLEARFGNGTVRVLGLVEPRLGGEEDGVVMPYHAYSPSGSVVARAVYVNFGREEDYKALEVMGVNVSGCVVVLRRGELSRGGAVEIAAGRGAVAVLMYTEEGREDGIERGTVMVGGLGDPLSPGWAAVMGGERLDVVDDQVLKKFPKIPSLPISARVAVEVLGFLGGPKVPEEWMGRVKFRGSGVGPGPVMLNLTYLGEKRIASIQNIFAIIKGSEEPDRYILLGNHRDAWTFGAVDPNSGTSALLDVARRYAVLMQSGWRPRRTIILCSWDAEEFGMIGSTEWVEQNLLRLRSNGVAYLNVDCAVQGSGFFAAATPQLDDVLIEVTKKVHAPYSKGLTVFEQWTSPAGGIKMQRLSGVDSDFAPFLQNAGIPSADIFYGQVAPVYHTAYDVYEWMINKGDPLFHRHLAVAGIWGLLALRLADDLVLPFNYSKYADELQEYAKYISNLVERAVFLDPLHTAIKELASAASEVQVDVKKVNMQEGADDLLVLKRRMLNDRLMLAERGFMDSEGLLERQWFKHLIYGPPSDYGNKQEYFPRIADALFRSEKMNKKERQAMYFQKSRFDPLAPDILYQGDAVPSVGSVELTKTNYVCRVGWVTYAERVPIWDSNNGRLTDFTCRFSFSIDTLNRSDYGSGLAFFLAPVGFNIPPNSIGGFLGLFNTTTTDSSRNQIVSVEFDSNGSDQWDPGYEHVGINNNSVYSAVTTPWNTSFHSGDTADVQISYNGTTKTLTVSWTYEHTVIPSEKTSLEYQIDLAKFLPERAMVGFSAATGRLGERHILRSWEFTSNLDIKDARENNKDLKLVVSLTVSCGMLVALAIVAFAIVRRKRMKERDSAVAMNLLSINTDLERDAGPKRFSREALAVATDNFSKQRKLGEGGFGSVYRGYLHDADKEVAVKKISEGSKQGRKEYITEVKIISRLRHRNLVQLIGWCHEKGDFLLVYEFMPNGSLNSHLFGVSKILAWSMRYKIALGIASGLLYLHEEWEQCVVHRDIKSSNIMLDSNFNVKVGDFGLARLMDHELGPQTTGLAGTIGYMAPEYINTGRASKESDVFSFGIVALEIATGQRAVDMRGDISIAGLVEWVWDMFGNEKLLTAMDEKLKDEYVEKEAECLMVVGLWCAHPDYRLRPSIRQAIQVLNFEAALPSLPHKMPIPMYQVPDLPLPQISSSDPSLTCTSIDQGR